MSKAKFTKGEWEAKETIAYKNQIKVKDKKGKQGKIIGNIRSRDNAHLIAAAPDMYEMLERFLPYSTFDIDGNETLHGGEFNWNEDDDPMIDELKKLLAKARGEQ